MAKDAPRTTPPGQRAAGGAKAVGAYLPRIAKEVFAAHGFPGAALLSEWPVLAGEELAAFTAPERLIWPRRSRDTAREDQTGEPPRGRRPEGATLVLRVDGPRAIEVQHGAPQIIERLNAYFGYRAVAALRIVQGPVVRENTASERQPDEPPPDETGLERIEDESLRTALARLGAHVGE
jgi:hypothetical protein